MTRVIGLSGFAGSGKTTAANYIEKTYGFERRHIAVPLRAMLAVLMRANGISEEMIERYLVGDLKDGVVVPEFGLTSRDMQILLGTECGRRYFGENVWVNTWHRGIGPDERVQNDSVRFPNEEAAIHEDDGITILIRRKGTGPAKFKWNVAGLPLGRWLYKATGLLWGVHDSERVDRLNPSFVIDNDDDIEDLHMQIDGIMDEAGIRPLGRPDYAAFSMRWGWDHEMVDQLTPSELARPQAGLHEIIAREAADRRVVEGEKKVAALGVMALAVVR